MNEEIDALIGGARELIDVSPKSSVYMLWRNRAEAYVGANYDDKTARILQKMLQATRVFRNEQDLQHDFNERIERTIEFLEQLKQMPPTNSASSTSESRTYGSKVFVVHGHNEAYKHKVARFLEHSGLDVTILDEEPNRGKTVIEKFEHHASDAGFAVVILSPDDVGGPEGSHEKRLRPRARQNVIFELGYFLGALGRDRVVALTQSDVEKPSDYEGVVYIPLDNWEAPLAKELRAANFVLKD